jgi:DNA-binding NarL/FixJ family response regulator
MHNNKNGKSKKILIVEDSPFFSNWISNELLNIEGIEITGIVDNVNDALATIKNKTIDIAILDIRLKDGSGTELIKYLKSGYKSIKVILFTNYPEFRKECLKLGADYFFDKSSEFDELINIISKLNNEPIQN